MVTQTTMNIEYEWITRMTERRETQIADNSFYHEWNRVTVIRYRLFVIFCQLVVFVRCCCMFRTDDRGSYEKRKRVIETIDNDE